jgi:hypothetical protein
MIIFVVVHVEFQLFCCSYRMQLTVVRLIMRDTIEETLYERNKIKHAATLSLNNNSQFGVEVIINHTRVHFHCNHEQIY